MAHGIGRGGGAAGAAPACVICAALLAGQGVAKAQTPATPAEPAPVAAVKPERTVDINLPLHLERAYLGDVNVRLTTGGEVRGVDGARLAKLMRPLLSANAGKALDAAVAAQSGPVTSLSALQIEGVSLAYDAENLRLTAALAGAATPQRSLRLVESAGFEPAADAIMPGRFSLGANMFYAQRYLWEGGPGADRGLGAPGIGLDGFANFGGLDGVYLSTRLDYDGDASTAFRRGPTTLFKDDRKRAIRYQFGDIDPQTLELQGAASLGGFSVSRAYSAIQPARNLRPSGRTRFVLDRPATVEVVVNGVMTRTLQLESGSYDLRDLTLAEGLNNVQLFAQDESGRREVASFSSAFSSTLLDPSIDEFNLSVGFVRESGQRGFGYDGARPQATGFYRRGLTSSLTVGGNFQLDRDVRLGGAEAVLATRLGAFNLAGALSHSDAGAGWAGDFAWRKLTSLGGAEGEVQAFLRLSSTEFRMLNQLLARDIGQEYGLQIRQILPGRVGFSASVSETRMRAGQRGRNATLSFSRPIGPFSVSLLHVFRDSLTSGSERESTIGVSYRLGGRTTVQGRYGARGEYQFEAQTAPTGRLGDWSFQGGVSGEPGSRAFLGGFDYVGNRGEFGLRSEQSETLSTGGRTRTSTLRGAMGFGFADGGYAFGRPFQGGFAVLQTHPTLRGRQVEAGRGGDEVEATTGRMGSALVSLSRPYQPSVVTVNVDDLPAGYDLGAARYELFPGARSGFKLTVGSDASNTGQGVLLAADGTPVALQSGELHSVERPKDEPIAFFTNRTGRFVAEKLRPGRYRVSLAGQPGAQAEIVVPKASTGLVKLGSVQLLGGAKP